MSILITGGVQAVDRFAFSHVPLLTRVQHGDKTLVFNERTRLVTLGLERAKVAPPSVYLALDGEPRAFHLLIPYIEVTEMLRVEGFSILKELLEALLDFPRSTLNICSLELDKLGLTERDQSVEPFESTSHILNDLHLTNVSLYPSSLRARTLARSSLTGDAFRPIGQSCKFLGGESLT